MKRKTYPFGCAGCGRTITHPYKGTGPGLAHAGHGLCKGCYTAWYTGGRPPLEEFQRTQERENRTYPFDCTACGCQITHPAVGTGPGQPHGGHGLCRTCSNVWRNAGRPPIETFRHEPNRKFYHKHGRCPGCGRKRPNHAEGLCVWCWKAWVAADAPCPATEWKNPDATRNVTYPFACVSCGCKIIGAKGRGDGWGHGAHGLCAACYTIWCERGRPEPVQGFHYTPKAVADRARYGRSVRGPRPISSPPDRNGTKR